MLEIAIMAFGGLALFTVCGWALWRGGTPERMGAISLLAFSLITPLVQGPPGSHASLSVLAVDALNLLVLAALNWRWRRLWIVSAMAFQIVQVATHLAMALGVDLSYRAYVTVLYLTFYGVLAAVAFAPFEARRLRETGG